MPIYALQLGAGPSEIGWIIGAFALCAFLSRLPIAWMIDRTRRGLIMATGAAIFGLSPLGYAAVGSIYPLLGLRAFNGVGMAIFTTAGQTLATVVSPVSRRAEAMAVYTTAYNIPLSFGPALGVLIAQQTSFPTVFFISAALGLMATLAALQAREPSLPAQTANPRRVWNRDALGPGVFMLTLMFAYGGMFTFVAILAIERHLPNAGLYFITYTAGLLLSQWSAGRLSDRYGRMVVILPGMVIAGVGMWALAFAEGWWILAAGLVVGVGIGAAQPSLFAVAADRSQPGERGSAMATIGMALEIGISAGAIIGGMVGQAFGLAGTFVFTGSLPVLGAILGLALPASRRWLLGRT